MTKSEFLAKLTQTFKGMEAHTVADIGGYVASLGEANIGKLWDYFEVNYLLVSPPRKGHVINAAEKAGIYPAERAQKYIGICYLCASRGEAYHFPVETMKCPRCGNGARYWTAIGPVGISVSRERGQEIIDKFPQGPSPWYSNTPEAIEYRRLQASKPGARKARIQTMLEEIGKPVERREPYRD